MVAGSRRFDDHEDDCLFVLTPDLTVRREITHHADFAFRGFDDNPLITDGATMYVTAYGMPGCGILSFSAIDFASLNRSPPGHKALAVASDWLYAFFDNSIVALDKTSLQEQFRFAQGVFDADASPSDDYGADLAGAVIDDSLIVSDRHASRATLHVFSLQGQPRRTVSFEGMGAFFTLVAAHDRLYAVGDDFGCIFVLSSQLEVIHRFKATDVKSDDGEDREVDFFALAKWGDRLVATGYSHLMEIFAMHVVAAGPD